MRHLSVLLTAAGFTLCAAGCQPGEANRLLLYPTIRTVAADGSQLIAIVAEMAGMSNEGGCLQVRSELGRLAIPGEEAKAAGDPGADCVPPRCAQSQFPSQPPRRAYFIYRGDGKPGTDALTAQASGQASCSTGGPPKTTALLLMTLTEGASAAPDGSTAPSNDMTITDAKGADQ